MFFLNLFSKSLSTLLFVLVIFSSVANCQEEHSLRISDKWNEAYIYKNDSIAHTVLKPVLYYDTIIATQPYSWLKRKFFYEHLLQVQKDNFNIYGDAIVDEYIGKSRRFVQTPMMNTRGFELKGDIASKFYFETSLYENQGRFPGYVDSVIRRSRIIPGQAKFKNIGDGKGFDFSYSTARLMYIPDKHLLFDLGYDKNFIGDGYRSLILSDYSTSYPYFKTSLTFGNFQYTAMWSQYIAATKTDIYALGYPRKWSQTFVIDWKATKNFTVSLIESVMWPHEDSLHNKDISWTLASPVIFLHSGKSPSGLKNNELIGLNLKYKLLPSTYLYSQLVADQLSSGKSWKNRYAVQAGIRSSDAFNIPRLNLLLEFNTARPYTYASDNLSTAYTHDNLALAHPLGANFKELIGVGDYTYKRWWFRLEAFSAKYGADSSAFTNYGQDITKPNTTHSKEDDVKTGQGLSTKLNYVDFRVAYIINPVSNLRIEAGTTLRSEKNSVKNYRDRYIYIGVRMSFRSLIYDF